MYWKCLCNVKNAYAVSKMFAQLLKYFNGIKTSYTKKYLYNVKNLIIKKNWFVPFKKIYLTCFNKYVRDIKNMVYSV